MCSLLVIARGCGIAVSVHLALSQCSCSEQRLAVGVNNHRQFLLFVMTLVLGIILFDYLPFECT